jgi:NAD-dependent SIR2 family protein deacetylase
MSECKCGTPCKGTIKSTSGDKVTSTESVVCPKCDHSYDEEEIVDLITYWGEKGMPTSCPACETSLLVTEVITRVWETKLK